MFFVAHDEGNIDRENEHTVIVILIVANHFLVVEIYPRSLNNSDL